MLDDIKTRHSERLGNLIALLADIRDRHSPTDPLYGFLKAVARESVEACFSDDAPAPIPLSPFGDLTFPYFGMGNIDSLNLFAIDEFIILAFYWSNRTTYRRVADFGANIGLHSFAMYRCGFDVRSFEPDPTHFERLEKNLLLNGCEAIELHQTAISTAPGEHEFVRVLGNTTGSHLSGAKADPYGDLDRITVRMEAAGEHLAWADLVKMDIEGHEAEVLCDAALDVWSDTDAIVEVGTEENAGRIFDHFSPGRVNLFAQKIAWAKVERLEDMPTSHRDGSLFITTKAAMPWG